MTDDLIARLRKGRIALLGHEIHQAADAIERLEAALAKRDAEVARLREELIQIEVDAMEHYSDWMEHGCEPVEAARFAFDLGQYARAALEGTSDE